MMSRISIFVLVLAAMLLITPLSYAQDDESRQASGLPTFIGNRPGANPKPGSDANISGSFLVQGLDESSPGPTFTVSVLANGSLVERQRVQNRGGFNFSNVPRLVGVTIVVEVDSQEVARYELPTLNPPPLNNRQDVIVTAMQVGQVIKRRNEVIAILNSYERTVESQKLFEKAMSSLREKKTDAATKLFIRLLEVDPKDFVAWTELGSIYFSSEKYSEAESSYNTAIGLKADFVPALLNLGKLHLNQKRFDQSVTILEKALAVAPQSADVHHYLGEAHLQNKRGSKAVGYLNKAIELAPTEKAELHLRLAALYHGANLKDKAANEYKLFIQKVPKYAEKAKLEKYIIENSAK